MDISKFENLKAIAYYSDSNLPEKYQIPHPYPLCLGGSLSFQPLPQIEYDLKIFDKFSKIISRRLVSGAQIEAAAHILARFRANLMDGVQPGSYLGDQTGTGKSRIVSLVILESYFLGHKRAVWISANKELCNGAQEELEAVFSNKIKPKFRFLPFSGKSTKKEVALRMEKNKTQGVLFSAYSTLRSGGNFNNLFRVAEWMGPGFDGVLVFDESHCARNDTDASKVIKWLQEKFPLAKVLYVTATVGTEPRHVSYMTRLGLWGPKCPFSDVLDFEKKMNARSLSAMELISIYLQSKGSFVARMLDVSNVCFINRVMDLSEEQRKIYNGCVLLWQSVYLYLKSFGNVEDMPMDYKAYWGRHQRFFDSLLVSFKAPHIKTLRSEYPKEYYSIVTTIQNTGNEAFIRMQDKEAEEFSLCGSMLTELFRKIEVPVPKNWRLDQSKSNLTMPQRLAELYSQVIDKMARNPIDQIISDLGGIDECAEVTGRIARPTGLNVEHNTTALSASMLYSDSECDDDTNESAEFDVAKDESSDSSSSESDTSSSDSESDLDETYFPVDKLPTKVNVSNERINVPEEVKQFMDGPKRAIIISQKGCTGISLHSDRKVQNQTQRVQVCIQPPWTPESGMQQLGRTNRSNQVSPPIHILLTTDVPGEQRFYTSFVEKLAKMASKGAMCQGERTASSNIYEGMHHPFSESTEIATKAAKEIVKKFVSSCPNEQVITEFTNVGLLSKDNQFAGDIKQFLNRTLGMNLSVQEIVYEELLAKYDDLVAELKEKNQFDRGMMGLSERWRLTILRDFVHGEGQDSCTLHHILADSGVHWVCLQTAIESLKRRGQNVTFFYQGPEIICYYVGQLTTLEDGSTIPKTVHVYSPWNCVVVEKYASSYEDWQRMDLETEEEKIKKMWEEMYNKGSIKMCIHKLRSGGQCKVRDCKEVRKSCIYVLRGCLLRIWDIVESLFEPVSKAAQRCQMQTVRISANYKKDPERKEKFVGLYIPHHLSNSVQATLSLHYANAQEQVHTDRKHVVKKYLKNETLKIHKNWKRYVSNSERWNEEDSTSDSNSESGVNADDETEAEIEEENQPVVKRAKLLDFNLSEDSNTN